MVPRVPCVILSDGGEDGFKVLIEGAFCVGLGSALCLEKVMKLQLSGNETAIDGADDDTNESERERSSRSIAFRISFVFLADEVPQKR